MHAMKPSGHHGSCMLGTMTKLLSSFVLVVLLVVILIAASAQKPTPFPSEFSVDFVTNVTDDNMEHPVAGKLFYSWPLRSQRIDHEAGSYECLHFYNTSHGCSLLFLPNGMYRFLGDDCCLDLAGVGTPPPDWAANANPTYEGIVHDKYSGLDTFQWAFDNLDVFTIQQQQQQQASPLPYHTAREVASRQPHAGMPVLFTFPGKANGRQDYHYNVDSLLVGPQDPSLFRLPDYCENVLCEQLSGGIRGS